MIVFILCKYKTTYIKGRWKLSLTLDLSKRSFFFLNLGLYMSRENQEGFDYLPQGRTVWFLVIAFPVSSYHQQVIDKSKIKMFTLS